MSELPSKPTHESKPFTLINGEGQSVRDPIDALVDDAMSDELLAQKTKSFNDTHLTRTFFEQTEGHDRPRAILRSVLTEFDAAIDMQPGRRPTDQEQEYIGEFIAIERLTNMAADIWEGMDTLPEEKKEEIKSATMDMFDEPTNIMKALDILDPLHRQHRDDMIKTRRLYATMLAIYHQRFEPPTPS